MPAIANIDGLMTKVIGVTDPALEEGTSYVFLVEDIDKDLPPGADPLPLLIDECPDPAVLWRFCEASRIDEHTLLLRFDAPDDEPDLELEVGELAQIRLILPGQLHERWDD